MLESVHIHNFALIEDLDLEFEPGLNVITGPTGSGKSLVMQSLKLALGQRAGADLVGEAGTDSRIGVFFREDDPGDVLQNYADGTEFHFRRRIYPDRGSPAYLNDERVRLKMLRNERTQLIDFHGQHDNQAVFVADFPRKALDQYGDYQKELENYHEIYREYQEIENQIEELAGPDSEIRQRLEFLNFQLQELDEFSPAEGEWEQIEETRRRLESSEEIQNQLEDACQILERDDSPHATTDQLLDLLEKLSDSFSELEEWTEELRGFCSGLKELRRQLHTLREQEASSEINYDSLMDRRGRWMELSRKHGVPPEQLYNQYQELSDEREQLNRRDERLEELRERRQRLRSKLQDSANELRNRRKSCSNQLQNEIESRLSQLNLEDAIFRIRVEGKDEFGPHGQDNVSWKFSSHSSQPPGPFSDRVSGGEISRVLLALKAALAAADTTSVLVFDEIDTGISGEEADRVGQVLAELAEHHQVICITHLPLVAAYADHHLLIRREDDENRVRVMGEPLQKNQRLEELSRLLSGDEESDISIKQAEELLEQTTKK